MLDSDDDDRHADSAPVRAFAPANLNRLVRHLLALQLSLTPQALETDRRPIRAPQSTGDRRLP